MKLLKRRRWVYVVFFAPDLLFFPFIFYKYGLSAGTVLFIGASVASILIKSALFLYINGVNYSRLRALNRIAGEFKKGRFLLDAGDISGSDEFSSSLKDLLHIGKELQRNLNTQQKEIDIYYDFYNNLLFSANSFFFIIDRNERAIYASEGFLRKFLVSQNDVLDKHIEDFFYFVSARLKGGIIQAKNSDRPVVLEKCHILSHTKVSLISTIKIIRMFIRGSEHVVIIIEDLTKEVRENYQFSIMNRISESIQNLEEIDVILKIILAAVTSGYGLGFNRAMLFLLEGDKRDILKGRMAVGPDSYEEALEIWRSDSGQAFLSGEINNNFEDYKGREFTSAVLNLSFPLAETDNVIADAVRNKKIIHVRDAANDPAVSARVREVMQVNEFAVVPLKAVDIVIGAIVVDNRYNQLAISRESINFLSMFSSQAAITIDGYLNSRRLKLELIKIEKKQSELVDAEKMIAVGKIASHLSHEIRNPLVTMGGYARRIIGFSEAQAPDSGRIKNAASIILREAERLESVLSNVMDFTRVSRSSKAFSDINDPVLYIAELHKNDFRERNIELLLDLDRKLPLIKSDTAQMKQVMLNLVKNSIEAMPQGGVLKIISYFKNNTVTVKIQDSGSGFEEENPEVIFEAFYTKKITGVGLGLANVKKIINDHGATIRARNHEDGGAELRIDFPFLD